MSLIKTCDSMKKSIYITSALIILIITTISCSRDKADFQSIGIITGPDYRECTCCGGWFIDISDTTYNFDNLPASSNIDLSMATFPITVKLDWSLGRTCGDIQYIDIIRIVKE